MTKGEGNLGWGQVLLPTVRPEFAGLSTIKSLSTSVDHFLDSLRRSLTCFLANTLNSSCKIHGLPHCQFWQVQICLLNIGCCPLGDELIEGLAIVGQLSSNLHYSCFRIALWLYFLKLLPDLIHDTISKSSLWSHEWRSDKANLVILQGYGRESAFRYLWRELQFLVWQ